MHFRLGAEDIISRLENPVLDVVPDLCNNDHRKISGSMIGTEMNVLFMIDMLLFFQFI